jgi:hypothetical protein
MVVFPLPSIRKTVSSGFRRERSDNYWWILVGYDLGGVLTSSKRDGEHKKQKEAHCLYPGDLYPFTRRPLFVVVDSDNSFVFQHIPRYFGQPLVTLMSPQDTPPAFQGRFFFIWVQRRRQKFRFRSTAQRFFVHTIPAFPADRILLLL